jgi:hypothetical protein
MVKRRKDLEMEYVRHFEPWLTAWQFGNKVYQVAVVVHPSFIRHLITMWGKRWYMCLWYWLKNPVALWSRGNQLFTKRRGEGNAYNTRGA